MPLQTHDGWGAMRRSAHSQDLELRSACHRFRRCDVVGERVWRRRGNYWEALLRFKEVLEREEAQILADSQILTEYSLVEAHGKIVRCNSERSPRRGCSSQSYKYPPCRQRIDCSLSKH
jgi:hypothetical protein